MAIPDFQTIMLPLLKLASDGKEHYIHDAVEELSNYFKLTEEEKGALLPSGTQSVFYNRVGWARSYMKAAKLLEDPRRTYFKITQRGLDLLAENPKAINNKILSRYPEFVKFRQRRPQRSDEIVEKSETDSTALRSIADNPCFILHAINITIELKYCENKSPSLEPSFAK